MNLRGMKVGPHHQSATPVQGVRGKKKAGDTPASESVGVESGHAPAATDSVTFSKPKRTAKAPPVEHWRSTSHNLAIKQALIIGAGPGGLAAAIALAKQNIDVTVIELRADDKGEKPLHARPHQISLRQTSLDSLKELNVYDEVIQKSGFVEKESVVKYGSGKMEVKEKVPKPSSVRRNSTFIHPGMLDTDSVSQVRISDIEKATYKEAKRLGVKIEAGQTAELIKNGKSYSVTTHQVDQNLEKTGKSTDRGTPDLVVVADGAGSPTRTALGIEFKEESEAKLYLGGHVQKGIGPQTTKVALQESDDFTRHIMGTGHKQYDQTWVSVEITPEEAKLSPKERTALLAEKSQWVFDDQKINPEDVGWGAGQLTTVQNRRADHITAGDNVVLFGDAAGTGSVWVGGGLNLALTTHLKALDRLVEGMSTARSKEPLLKIYGKTIQWATTRWHKAGASQLMAK